MPLYEYECEGGHEFEALKSIGDRYNTLCPICMKAVRLKVSTWARVIVAGPFTVIGHDGTVLDKRQTIERTAELPERIHGGRY